MEIKWRKAGRARKVNNEQEKEQEKEQERAREIKSKKETRTASSIKHELLEDLEDPSPG